MRGAAAGEASPLGVPTSGAPARARSIQPPESRCARRPSV